MLVEKFDGKPVDEVKQFTAKDMLDLFGARLTPNRQKCCLLSWRVLQAAIYSPVDRWRSRLPRPATPGHAHDEPRVGQPLGRESLRGDFPILSSVLHADGQHDGVPLVYLDNAATHAAAAAGDPGDRRRLRAALRQRPPRHPLAQRTERPNCTKRPASKVQALHRRRSPRTRVIFTCGTTESINLVARSWGDANVQRGRRNPADRDGAPLEPRALAATGRAHRRASCGSCR